MIQAVADAALHARSVEIAAGIAAASSWTVREMKRRILEDHERLLFPLLEDETRVLRERLTG